MPINDERLDFGKANKSVTFGFGFVKEAYAMAMPGVVNAHHKRTFRVMVRIYANCWIMVTDQQPCHHHFPQRAEECLLQVLVLLVFGRVLVGINFSLLALNTRLWLTPETFYENTTQNLVGIHIQAL